MDQFEARPKSVLLPFRAPFCYWKFAQWYNFGLGSSLRQLLVFHPNMPPNKSTIAIVEDDASFRRAVERLLCASGFDAQSFASAEEFLHATEPESHACLIIDLHLPGISGIDLVERLTASAARPPAIFITAQENENFRERVSRIPESVYLRKPFPGVALLEAVNAALKKSSPNPKNPST